MSQRVLVTGGAGFIGSSLCRRLLEGGNTVICLDNFMTGSRENVIELLNHPSFSLLEHDIIEEYDYPEVDIIYNLACPASPPHYQRDPIHTIRTNAEGMRHLLEHARRGGARILQASTSEVYGDPEQHPQTEQYRGNVNPTGPRACYDEGKRLAETLCFDYQRKYQVDIRVVRIFNTYGPRMDPFDGRVVSNFIVQALTGRDLTLYGDGSQTRSFCYVDDLVDGLMRMMACPDFSGPVNLGNPSEFTVRALAEKVLALTGSSARCVFLPLPIDDPTRRRPDISLADERLGWRPRVDLEEGLRHTVDYFRALVQSGRVKEGAP